MGQNSTEVAYGFGQLGSVYSTASSDAIKPPTGKVFVAITMIEDTTFDSTGGLIADRIVVPGANAATVPSKTGDIYVGTDQAAHDLAAGSETADEGSGGQVVDSVIFARGITIYGRWTEIDVAVGGIIAYVGE